MDIRKIWIVVIAAAGLAGGAAWAAGPVARKADPVPGRYIVVLRNGVARTPEQGVLDGPSAGEVGQAVALAHRGRLLRSFDHALSGFALDLPAAEAAALASDPRVAHLEQDAWIEPAGVQLTPPSWGLDDIDQRGGPLNHAYTYGATGAGVHAFVLDTGILSSHGDFGGRVDTADAYSTIADGRGSEDCNGHGTHVAGILGGTTFGVAKDVILHPVRVVDCSGRGTLSDLIAGVDWVTATVEAHQKGSASRRWRAVANISLHAPQSWSLDTAVRNSIEAGITYVVAAGNSASDACLSSPGDVAGTIVVGASDSSGRVASFSNVGPCVDLFAPGVSITSAWIRSDSDQAALSGTSVAAPHAAGVAAMILGAESWAAPADVQRLVVESATADELTGVAADTPNLALYSGSIWDDTDDPPIAAFTASCRRRQMDCAFDASPSFDDRGVVAYRWDFGDGATGSRERLRHRFPPDRGSYVVTLTVTDTAGQTSSFQEEAILYYQ